MRILHIEDTIVAQSSTIGPGARAIVRISGPQTWQIIGPCLPEFSSDSGRFLHRPECRQRVDTEMELTALGRRLPVTILFFAAPNTYTGQDLAEIHLVSSPPIVESLIAQVLNQGARAAQPGEFTMRAFLVGKLDLTQAEAVLGVIEAESEESLSTALRQLAGGIGQPLTEQRNNLLNVLAEIEAGLDFVEEDIQFISGSELLARLTESDSMLRNLCSRMDQRSIAGRPFRVALAGRPNVGKSSLFNRIIDGPGALVSPIAGTTRDYLTRLIAIDGLDIELIDTAGAEELAPSDEIGNAAQQARASQINEADLILLCQEPGEVPEYIDDSRTLRIKTKCDSTEPGDSDLATSAVTGRGIEELRSRIARAASELRQRGPDVPGWSRCVGHIRAALVGLNRTMEAVEHNEPMEHAALELRAVIDELGEMVGAIYTDDLLDRVFSQFCIGK